MFSRLKFLVMSLLKTIGAFVFLSVASGSFLDFASSIARHKLNLQSAYLDANELIDSIVAEFEQAVSRGEDYHLGLKLDRIPEDEIAREIRRMSSSDRRLVERGLDNFIQTLGGRMTSMRSGRVRDLLDKVLRKVESIYAKAFPPIYKQWWFWTIILIAVIGIGLGLYFLVSRCNRRPLSISAPTYPARVVYI